MKLLERSLQQLVCCLQVTVTRTQRRTSWRKSLHRSPRRGPYLLWPPLSATLTHHYVASLATLSSCAPAISVRSRIKYFPKQGFCCLMLAVIGRRPLTYWCTYGCLLQPLHAMLRGIVECRKKDEEEIDPEQLRKDMERLELIKQRRCPLCEPTCTLRQFAKLAVHQILSCTCSMECALPFPCRLLILSVPGGGTKRARIVALLDLLSREPSWNGPTESCVVRRFSGRSSACRGSRTKAGTGSRPRAKQIAGDFFSPRLDHAVVLSCWLFLMQSLSAVLLYLFSNADLNGVLAASRILKTIGIQHIGSRSLI